MSTLHVGMFALSFIGEINTIRLQYKEKDRKLVYLSSTLSQLELLFELYFGHLNETVEPLIYFFEAVKSLLKFREYMRLITTEKMSHYVSKELYDVHVKDEERKKSMLLLPRSKKYLPKPDKFPFSNKLVNYSLKSSNNTDSSQNAEGDGVMRRFNSENANLPVNEEWDSNEERKYLLSMFKRCIMKKLTIAKKLAKSKKLKIVEILLILRPVLYMYSLLKLGKDSYTPYFISLIIDGLGIFMGYQTMENWRTETEKAELSGRIRGLLKYILKEPIYSKWTVRIVYLLLHKLINDSKIGYVLGILSYFKYYWYIV